MVALPRPEPPVTVEPRELLVEVEFEFGSSLGVTPAQTFLKSASATSALDPQPLEIALLTVPAFLPQIDFRSAEFGWVLNRGHQHRVSRQISPRVLT